MSRQGWRGRGASGGGGAGAGNAEAFKDTFFRNFFISMLDSSKFIKWDPSDDKIDKSFFMSLLEDKNSKRTTVGMVMAAIIATGNNKDYYNKVYKWIKKKPNAEPDHFICTQFGYIMKLAEYITKTVSKSDVDYWKKILTEAWWKQPQKGEDIWPMIFANYWPNTKQLSINGKDYVYVIDKTSQPLAQNPTQASKQTETKNFDEDTFQDILSSNTSNKKTVGIVLEAIIAAKQNHQRYDTIIKWIGKITPPNLTPALSKQFLHYRKLSDYLATDLSERESQYWGDILGSTEYQLPQDTKDIWPSIFGNAAPNVLSLSFVGKSHVYKKNPSAMPPKKSVTPKGSVNVLPSKGNENVTPVVNTRAPITAPSPQKIEKPSTPKPAAPQPSAQNRASSPQKVEKSSTPKPAAPQPSAQNRASLPQKVEKPSTPKPAAPQPSAQNRASSPQKVEKPSTPKPAAPQPSAQNTASLPQKVEKPSTPKPAAPQPSAQKPTPASSQAFKKSETSNQRNLENKTGNQQQTKNESVESKTANQQQTKNESEDNMFTEDFFKNILESNNAKTKSVGTVLAAVIAANQKEDRYEKVIRWLGKSKPPKLNRAISEQFLMYRNLSEYLTKSVPAEDTQYWLQLLRDTEYQLPISGTEIWPCLFGKAIPNVLGLSINYEGEICKKISGSVSDNESLKTETSSPVKTGKHIQVALVGDSHIYNLPCRMKETFKSEFGDYTLIKYCDRKARPDYFHNTRAWNDFKITKPNIVVLYLGGCNIQKLPNAKSLAGNVIWYHKQIMQYTDVLNERFYIIGLEKRKSSPIVNWNSYRNSVNTELSNHFGDKNFFVFDQADDEIDTDGKNMGKDALKRLLDCIKDAAVSVLQFGEELNQVDAVDSSANGTPKSETKADAKKVNQVDKVSSNVNGSPKSETKRKVDENVQQVDAKKVKSTETANTYNKSPQKRQQPEQGNTANAKKLATEKKEDSPKTVPSNEGDDEFTNLLNKTVGSKSVGVVLEAVEVAKNDKVRYHRILKWIGISRFMTPMLEKQLSMYCKLSEYLKENLTPIERGYWKKILSGTVYQAPSKPFEDVWENIFGNATPNIYKITMEGKDSIYKQGKFPAKVEPKPTPEKITPNFKQSNTSSSVANVSKDAAPKSNPTKDVQTAVDNSNKAENLITIAVIGDSSIELLPSNQIIECPFGSYSLKKYCKTGETIDNFIKTNEWKEMIKSNADVVILSLGGDSLSSFVSKQINSRSVSDKLLQWRREIMKLTKLTPKSVYVVGLGKKKPSDTYWRKLRTEVNQFIEQVLTKKQFFIPEDLQLDAIQPNINKTANVKLQNFINDTYNNFKNPFSQSTGITSVKQAADTPVNNPPVKATLNQGNFNQYRKPMAENGKAANSPTGSGDLRNFLGNQQQRSSPANSPVPQQQPAPRQPSAHEYLKNFGKKDVLSRLGGFVNSNEGHQNQFGAGNQQGNNRQNQQGGAGGRNFIAQGQTGRQVHF